MLRSIHQLTKHRVRARDGDLGRADDFLFDERTWDVRYFVIDTGTWLPKQRVLVSPQSIQKAAVDEDRVRVDLSRQQIEDSPEIHEHKPVSLEHEEALAKHYGWRRYWAAPEVNPHAVHAGGTATATAPRIQTFLRSAEEVRKYRVEATDGSIGHVEDFIVDTDDWKIRYLILATRNWLPGRKVMVSPDWAQKIDWASEQITMDLTQEAIRKSPEFRPDFPVNRQTEVRLYDYHGRPYYWDR